NLKREELLADRQAPRVASSWIVVAARSEVQPDKLRRLETWLLNAAPAEGAAPFALLVDYVPVSAGVSASPFAAGETLAGEVVYYPSATPLRGLLATRTPCRDATAWPALPDTLETAFAAYETALTRQPWIEAWPLAAAGVTLERAASDRLVLTGAEGLALPLESRQTEALLPLLGLGAFSAILLWDGRCATLLAADTSIGAWHQSYY
ncbi:MAG: SWIM zinc finger family protein, partial [Hyphomicrobiaceae bacterium]